MEDLQRIFGNWEDVLFLEEAIKQVIDCRRMLKWTYAFGYFLGKSYPFFEFQQGQLEQKIDQLQALFENSDFIRKDLQLEFDLASGKEDASALLVSAKNPSNVPVHVEVARVHFMEWKAELTNLTKLVSAFFENINDFFEKECFDGAEWRNKL